TAKELGSTQVELAEELEQVALAALQERHPERVLATNVEYYSAIVLDVAEIPPRLAPAMFACSRVAGWSAHILEQKRAGLLSRDHPGDINADRPLLHKLVSDAEENPAVRRLAVMSLKNGSPQRDTIVILESLAGDDEADRELRAAAKRVAELLKKKGR